MAHWPQEPRGEDHRAASPLAVRLDDQATEPLSLQPEGGHVVATLRAAGLKRRAVVQWLERCQVPVFVDPAVERNAHSPVTLLRLPTLVVCADSRIRDLAALYAHSVDAPLCIAQAPDEIVAAIDPAASHESVTIFVLNDRLDEPLCHAMAVAARRRPGLSYGFLSAFTPEQVAWLMVKTWALLLRPFPESVGFADWSFSGPYATARVRSVETGATRHERADAPWLTDSVTMLSLRAHGAPFDLSMGRVVLCGHLDPSLPRERTLRAPSCFHDGVCFRMKPANGAPSERLQAVDASPLVWCLDSCATFPLTGNAFGDGTSYAFGLIAGAAAGVIGPFLDLTTQGSMSRHCEAVLATGGTLGEVAAAACSLEPGLGFDKFLLVGCPDLRLLPAIRLEGRRDGEGVRYHVRRERQYAFRLAVPSDLKPPVHVVGDDGGAHWAVAQCHLFEHGASRDLVICLEEPLDIDGWLLVGSGATTNERLAEEARQIADNLDALRLYPFVDSKAEAIVRCRRLARSLRDVVAAPGRLRCRVDTTVLLASLTAALDTLHRQVANGFLTAVAAHDVNLDRFASDGDRMPTSRSAERCPTCGVSFYVTRIRRRRKRSYVRRWVQCPNCSGLSMTPEHSPLEIPPPVAARDGDRLTVSLEIRNRTDSPVEAMVAGLARQGSPADAVGPLSLILSAGEVERLHLSAPLNAAAPGVISYRVLVLCRAGVELLALKHVLTPVDVAGSSAGTGHAVGSVGLLTCTDAATI